jgi:hypothetical protein
MTRYQMEPVSIHAPGGDAPVQGIGLCLSGGGYRAMLFHTGVLLRLARLAELGYFGTKERTGMHGPMGSLMRVSSVSGGSITAGVLGLAWQDLRVDDDGIAERFREHVMVPIQDFAGQTTISITSGIKAMIFSTIARSVAKVYRRKLYGTKTLQDLPDYPRFVINATNLQSGELWRFSKPYNRDWRVGEIANPDDQIARSMQPIFNPANCGVSPNRTTATGVSEKSRILTIRSRAQWALLPRFHRSCRLRVFATRHRNTGPGPGRTCTLNRLRLDRCSPTAASTTISAWRRYSGIARPSSSAMRAADMRREEKFPDGIQTLPDRHRQQCGRRI